MALDVRGKTVVLTGTFSRLKRADAEAQLVLLGAKIGGGVTKATHVLFAGEKAGSKIDAANKLGVTVLGEDELMAVLRGGASEAAEVSGFMVDPELAGDALAAVIEGLAWDTFAADRDLPGLRAALYVHEARHGITAAHRAATARIRPLALLAHAHGHDVEVEWSDMAPDGRFFATGSWTGDDYERGGVLQIWDVGAGRCVNMLRIRGGVGWPGYPGCVRWRPDGRRVGLAFATNGVGSFDPFGRTGEPESCAYITDGWSRPPAWAWAPNSRDVYIACWGPQLRLGAVVPLVGRDPQPRWCASLERTGDPQAEPRLQPMKQVWWNHPERIVGVSGWDQVFALDARTGDLLWDGMASPPVMCSPDGAELAMHPAGLVYYDTRTGLPNGKAPLHVGASQFLWSRDGSRMAAIVQPENAWSAAPGVFIYEGGVYRGSLEMPAPRTNGTYAAAWRPDGRRLAVTSRGRLQIWEIEGPACALDVEAPGSGVTYGDGVLVAWGKFGLTFVREADGAVIGAFKLAVEASDTSPLSADGEDFGAGMTWNPAFPVDDERVAAALPEGVVIGPSEAPASVAEIDAKIAWVVDRKWAWPWRWGEAKVWADPAAACADKAAPAAFKRKFARAKAKVNSAEKVKAAPRSKQAKTWPPPGGSLDDVVGLLEGCVKQIAGGYHAGEFRRDLAVQTMKLGMFERAAAAIEGGPGWVAAWDPWWSAYARGATVVAALGRSEAPTAAQRETLRRWLVEGEAALPQIGALWTACRPQALLGAGWMLLGERERGEALLAAAVAGIDPENNGTEHRAVVAEAYVALGKVGAAIDVLTSGAAVSWTYAAPVIVEICERASAAELELLRVRMAEKQDRSESILFERGIDRLIALAAWDAGRAWLAGFTGFGKSYGEARLVAAMFAAGEVARAEATGRLVDPADPRCAEILLAVSRGAPERARAHLARILERAPTLLGREFLAALAGAAVRLGSLDVAAKLEALGRERGEVQAVRMRVLAELDPADPAWAGWFARASTDAPDGEKAELAALASRAKLAAAGPLLDEAIEVARKGYAADIDLMEVSRKLGQVGDLAGAHRAWLAIAKGKRSSRNGWLIDACVAMGAWAGVLELLAAMPMDLNGAPNRANQILRRLTGGED